MMRLFFIITCFLLYVTPIHAAELAIDLAEDHVDITTGFTGDDLVLFGTKAPGSEVAITIKGPSKTMVVRRKDRVLGMWMNRKSVEFLDVPGYYNFALSRPELSGISDLRAQEVGTEALPLKTKKKVKAEKLKVFRESLIRNKQAQNLFPQSFQQIVPLTDEFFRTRFTLPPNVPVGDYEIMTYLVKGDEIVDSKVTSVKVAQIGTSATVNHFAQTKALLYGVLCVLFAVAAGWLSYAVRQRLR